MGRINLNFNFFNTFILRTPYLPFKANYTDENVKGLFSTDPYFREAVYLASPELYGESLKSIKAEEDRSRILNSLRKYTLRMSSRSTPFGLFANCSTGNWADKSSTEIFSETRRKTRLDMFFLCELADVLSKTPSIKEYINYYPNTSIYKLADEIRFVEYSKYGSKRIHEISAVYQSDELTELLEKSKPGIRYHAMVDVIKGFEYTDLEAVKFVDDCLDSKLFHHELEPQLTGEDVLSQILKTLSRIEDEGAIVKKEIYYLSIIKKKIRELDLMPFNNISSYVEIIDIAKRLDIPIDDKAFFQVDTFRQNKGFTLDESYIPELQNSIAALNMLSPAKKNERLEKFKKSFIERYGDKQMPLLVILDTETGLGYGESSGSPKSSLLDSVYFERKVRGSNQVDFSRTDEYILEKLYKSVSKGEKEMSIDLVDLISEFGHVDDDNLSDTMSCIAYLVQKDRFYLESVSGSSAVNLLGRFGYADTNIRELIDEIVAKENAFNNEHILAEIVHLPESRVGNILQHPAYRDYEIPYLARPLVANDRVIGLDDLYVSIKNSKVFIWSKKLNKAVIPHLSNAHNYNRNTQPVYQFLCDLQSQDRKSALAFNWPKVVRHLSYLPRVLVGDVIISLSTWNFDAKGILSAVKECAKTKLLSEFVAKWKLPRFVSLVDGDNTLVIDLDKGTSVEMFCQLIKSRSQIVLREFPFIGGLNYPVRDDLGRPYINQLILPIFKQKKKSRILSIAEQDSLIGDDAQRHFVTGSDWLYFKVYAGTQVIERLLAEEIYKFVQETKSTGLIEEWFFVRFNDPHHHLRLRFKLSDKKKTGELIELFNTSFLELFEGGMIWKICLDTYERELERYGCNGILLAEKFFSLDSDFVLDTIRIESKVAMEENTRWLLAMRSTEDILTIFQFTLNDKLEIMKTLAQAFEKEFNSKKKTYTSINNKYREHRKKIYNIMESKAPGNAINSNLLRILAHRNDETFAEVAWEVQKLVQINELGTTRFGFISSLIHMHLNRLFPFDQRAHEMVLYEYLYTYYRSKKATQKL